MFEIVLIVCENRDMSCFNFVLNWFFNFGCFYFSMIKDFEINSVFGFVKESFVFFCVKVKEIGMFFFWSFVLFMEVKIGLENGDSIVILFEYMMRSLQFIVEKNMKIMFGFQMFLVMVMWDRLGLVQVVIIIIEVFL